MYAFGINKTKNSQILHQKLTFLFLERLTGHFSFSRYRCFLYFDSLSNWYLSWGGKYPPTQTTMQCNSVTLFESTWDWKFQFESCCLFQQKVYHKVLTISIDTYSSPSVCEDPSTEGLFPLKVCLLLPHHQLDPLSLPLLLSIHRRFGGNITFRPTFEGVLRGCSIRETSETTGEKDKWWSSSSWWR